MMIYTAWICLGKAQRDTNIQRHDMLFLSALELVQTCQKHGILIRTDCVIHFCDEQGTWHTMTHAGMAMELMQNTEETRKLLRELSRAGIPFYLKG